MGAPVPFKRKRHRRERERNVVAKDICRENSCEPVCRWKFRKCMYRCQTAGFDVDDRSRRMRATLVSPGFSMHAECTGGETLFTSYALATPRIGNPRCALAVAFREKARSTQFTANSGKRFLGWALVAKRIDATSLFEREKSHPLETVKVAKLLIYS